MQQSIHSNQTGSSILLVIVAFFVTSLIMVYLFAQTKTDIELVGNYTNNEREFEYADNTLAQCENLINWVVTEHGSDIRSYNATQTAHERINMLAAANFALSPAEQNDQSWLVQRVRAESPNAAAIIASRLELNDIDLGLIGHCFFETLPPPSGDLSSYYRVTAVGAERIGSHWQVNYRKGIWLQSILATDRDLLF